MQENRGPRLGWIWGGLGSIIWILLLAVVMLIMGNYLASGLSIVFFIAACSYIIKYAPWKHPDTAFGKIYLGLFLIIFIAAVTLLLLWDPNKPVTFEHIRYLFFVLPGLIPVFTLGKKTWSQLHDN